MGNVEGDLDEADAFVTRLDQSDGTVRYTTYIGGTSDEEGFGIALDTAGNLYATGWTNSDDRQVTGGAYDLTYNGNQDAFVAKLNAASGARTYGSYLGGSQFDHGHSIAVVGQDNVVITGETVSATDFPTHNAYQNQLDTLQASDAFVTQLDLARSGDAALLYSTYLRGDDNDRGLGVAVDQQGYVYVTGDTTYAGFPITHALTGSGDGSGGAFVVKLDPRQAGAASLVYGTALGAAGVEVGYGIAVDRQGSAYVTGAFAGSSADAFVIKLTAAGTATAYRTTLGGAGYDTGYAIALDAANHAYITGETDSNLFPGMGAPQSGYGGGGTDGFMAHLDASGSRVWASYLGGGRPRVGRASGWIAPATCTWWGRSGRT